MRKKQIEDEFKDIIEYSSLLKASKSVFKLNWDVYRLEVGDKFYTLLSFMDDKPIIIVKGLIEENDFMVNNYASVTPGYHMNKKHWITIDLSQEEFSSEEINNFIKQSYLLVINKLSKKKKEELYLL